MKRFLLSLLVWVSLSPAFSQKVYFIYLQTENDQPFFVKMDEKIYSSTASGYLLLSKLRDSIYTFSVGFPQNKFPEQRFSIEIRGKDRGYLVKNFGEKGWGLFDLQTLSILMALPDKSSHIKMVPRDDISPFTELLAKAANDPSLKERAIAVKRTEDDAVAIQPAVLKEEVKTTSIPPIEKEEKKPVAATKDSSAETDNKQKVALENKAQIVTENKPAEDTKQAIQEIKPPADPPQQLVIDIVAPAIVKDEPGDVKKETVPDSNANNPAGVTSNAGTAVEYKKSVVTKKSESSTTAGLGLTFIDEYSDGKKDTIRILIPNPRTNRTQTEDQAKKDVKFLDMNAADTAKQSAAKALDAAAEANKGAIKTGCNEIASDNDFLKLQKKMMGERGDDNMIDEAKKVFKTKCFSSGQLKTLSILFTNDSGKYKFFDAAYPHVSDTGNFPSLVAELKDEYYVNRFKAMLRPF